jgi:hypothetical protein
MGCGWTKGTALALKRKGVLIASAKDLWQGLAQAGDQECSSSSKTPIAPEEEGDLERVTKERTKIGDEETHGLGRDNKLEGTLAKLGDLKLSGRATKGGLQENTNIIRGEVELGATKSGN